MEVTIRIPDELVALAKARGLPVEEYVEELLSQFLGSEGTETQRFRSAQEIRAWLDSLSQFSDKIPPLLETITRDWIYQGHE
jgi:hypothetical protein